MSRTYVYGLCRYGLIVAPKGEIQSAIDTIDDSFNVENYLEYLEIIGWVNEPSLLEEYVEVALPWEKHSETGIPLRECQVSEEEWLEIEESPPSMEKMRAALAKIPATESNDPFGVRESDALASHIGNAGGTLPMLMYRSLPDEIREEFGNVERSINGDFLTLPQEKKDEILQRMEELGYSLEEDQEVIQKALAAGM